MVTCNSLMTSWFNWLVGQSQRCLMAIFSFQLLFKDTKLNVLLGKDFQILIEFSVSLKKDT